jgi:hypothetical protein
MVCAKSDPHGRGDEPLTGVLASQTIGLFPLGVGINRLSRLEHRRWNCVPHGRGSAGNIHNRRRWNAVFPTAWG